MSKSVGKVIVVLGFIAMVSGCVSRPDSVVSIPEPLPVKSQGIIPDEIIETAEAMCLEMKGALNDNAALAGVAERCSAELYELRLANLDNSAAARYLDAYRRRVENVRIRAHRLDMLCHARRELETVLLEGDDDAIINAAESYVGEADIAIACGNVFSPTEIEEFRITRKDAEWELIARRIRRSYEQYSELYKSARTAAEAVELCAKAANVIDAALKRKDLFDFQTRKRLAAIQAGFKKEGCETQAEFDELLRQTTALLERQRKDFVKKRAIQDLSAAKKLLKKEDVKFWFNFGGCREDVDNLMRAAGLCRRARTSTAAWRLRDRGAALYSKIDRHLWRAHEKRRLNSLPRLPKYNRIAGWPDWSPEKAANKLWLEKRQAPRLPDTSPADKETPPIISRLE